MDLLNQINSGDVEEMSKGLRGLQALSEDFSYRPLDKANSEIRLFKLKNNIRDDESAKGNYIAGELTHASLNDSPHYIALSYVWGDITRTIPIILDGHFFYVTENLYYELHSLEQAQGNIILWIDAICINQQDEEEKSWQVQQMCRIYRSAWCVFVCLGLDYGENYRIPLEGIVTLSNIYDQLLPYYEGPEAVDVDKDDLRAEAASLVFSDTSLRWDLIYHLICERPWFTRVWCVQELLVARKAHFLCAGQIMDWETLFGALLVMNLILEFSAAYIDGPTWIKIVQVCNTTFHLVQMSGKFGDEEAERLPFLELLTIIREAPLSATVPKDHIYALLGLVSKEERTGITVDYDSSVSLDSVLLETTKALLLIHGANVLINCGSSLRPGLPSWVIDWTSEGPPLDRSSNRSFDASKDLHHDALRLTSSIEEKILNLEAMIIGTISLRGSPFEHPKSPLSYSHAEICRQWLTGVMDLISSAKELEMIDLTKLENSAANVWRLPIGELCSTGPAIDKQFEAFQLLMETASLSENIDFDSKRQAENKIQLYLNRWISVSQVPFVMSDGSVGLGPPELQVDDLVFIVSGASMPLIMRRETDRRYRIISSACILGMMSGEAVSSESQLQPLEII